ncbi:MAG: PLP-dependent aminotransferase family protein [Synergistaceae bacterium]|nr:PLP-dependent aminotransferase family protein [Synergistaceae bacterium]
MSSYSDRILATKASFIREILKVTQDPSVISFAGGLPNPISFPQEALKQSTVNVIDKFGDKVFQYSTTEGYLPLREQIAERYNKNQGLHLEPKNILITTGSQQALDLLAKVYLNKGDKVVVEEPGYLGAIQTFTMFEVSFLPVTLEDDGLNLEELERALQDPKMKFAYTVPNFQNPTGLTYGAEKRKKIAELFAKYNKTLIEDDPYGDLRFKGEFLPYMGAEKLESSVLLGSFSKTVTPGMRTGYLITKNDELMHHLVTAKQSSDLHTNIFCQYILADYFANNDFASHVSKIRALYKEQSETMLSAMKEYFPSDVKFTQPEGGMFIWVTLPKGKSALDLFNKCMAQKVAFVPGDPFYTNKTNVNTLRLNYTNSSKEVIVDGIKRLAQALKED